MRNAFFSVAVIVFGGLVLSGCRDIGFRQIDVSAKSRESLQTAHEVMAQVQQGIHNFYEAKHHFPETNEAFLYDSIRTFMPTQIDPIDLYRNDNGKGYFIAIGSRSERIIYRYPPTIGVGDYTLYWVGPNGVDEEGEGDDVDAWQSQDTSRHFERQRRADMQNDNDPDQLRLIRTGPDIYRDSIIFEITRRDSIRYRDTWPLSAYFKARPQLTDEERKQIIRTELDRFFQPGSFVHTDSLAYQDWSHWAQVEPKSPAMAELMHGGGLMFNYYAGDQGSKGIAWLPSSGKFVNVWKSGN